MSSLYLETNIHVLWRVRVTTSHLPVVGTYRPSGSVVNLHQANTRCQPFGQHVGALAGDMNNAVREGDV